MSLKLLIDAQHSEETRVALVNNNKLLEYDFESENKQTIRGNIYLAKVMRVEPSLQAAFVEYGGNRHGFLAFSEIHPDYFRIPVSDREVLTAKLHESTEIDEDDIDSIESEQGEHLEADDLDDDAPASVDYDMSVSTVSGNSALSIDEAEEQAKRRPQLHKMYKIQEVIHKNQILLIQVVREERGQKGAALTTYLSLAGRYCVLMPNSPQAGGISRKISNPKARKDLRSVLEALEIPKEMGLIIRTAGQGRTKAEVKKDTDYLKRLWNEIREQTLSSTAPALIYQEDNIIKRVIRDQYNKDVDEILIHGEASYKVARDFMKKLLPSHAKKIKLYKDDRAPLFIIHKVESQIEAMHESIVQLPSGGSIVINPTEALVAIDINSGRATRERHIAETALNTNMEAAAEIARQVRLRDLAGLIVIDFIDMHENRYAGRVERKLHEAFKNDRARVQMGRISPFGLLELSRQRLRPSILETSSNPCPHCQATGYVRSTESIGLQILRSLQEEGIANRSASLKITAAPDVAFYLLNTKRTHIIEIQTLYDMTIDIVGDYGMGLSEFRLLQLAPRAGKESKPPQQITAQNPKMAQGDREKTGQAQPQRDKDSNNKDPRRKQNRRPQKKVDAQHKKPDQNLDDKTPISDPVQETKDHVKEPSSEGHSERRRRHNRRSSRSRNSRGNEEKKPDQSQDHSTKQAGENADQPQDKVDRPQGDQASNIRPLHQKSGNKDGRPPRNNRNKVVATNKESTPAPQQAESQPQPAPKKESVGVKENHEAAKDGKEQKKTRSTSKSWLKRLLK